MYCWVDGIHLKVRLDQDKVCLLVMIGVRGDGTKELIALADGFRESAESWADLLREGKRRGMAAPVLAIGDGALGFWKAIREGRMPASSQGLVASMAFPSLSSEHGCSGRAVTIGWSFGHCANLNGASPQPDER